MSACRWGSAVVPAVFVLAASLACNDQRKQECDRFLAAMKPLEKGTPASSTVDAVSKQVEGLSLQDATLAIYAKNYRATLLVLSNALKLKEGSSPPDGTDAVIEQNLKAARTDAEDAGRYCAP